MNQEPTDISTLPPAERALIVLSSTKTEVMLRELAQEASTIIDVIDADGCEQAHRLGMRLRGARTTIEKAGKAARDDATKFAKAVIKEENRLIALTEGEEKRVLGLRDRFDAAIEAEKAAKAAAEAKRIADIKAKIDAIRSLPLALAGETADVIEAERAAFDAFTPLQADFAEFTDECIAAATEVSQLLIILHSRVKGQEAATALIAAERDRLAEVERAANEALAAERAAIASERAEMEAERKAWAEQKAALTAVSVAPEAGAEESNDAPSPVAQPEPSAADWNIRQIALATADQFDALAQKVLLCGADAFANDLIRVADALRLCQFDTVLAQVSLNDLIEADNKLLDATVNCINALSDAESLEVAA